MDSVSKKCSTSVCTSKFIIEIEKILAQRVKAIKPAGTLLSDSLQYYDKILVVYKEAFSAVLEKMATYRPILCKIKDVYEKAINIKDKYIRTYGRIHNFTSQADATKDNAYESEIKNLSHENAKLKDENLRLESSINKLQQEMYADHNKLLSDRGARYTLFFENVNLHMKLKELDGSNYSESQPYDPFIMKIALDRTRQELSRMTRELRLMKDTYSRTVPMAEYDTLEMMNFEMEKEVKHLRMKLQEYKEMNERLTDSFNSTKDEMLDLKDKLAELERLGTPRPQWDVCANVIKGGSERWRSLTGGLSSQKILHVVLRELGPSGQITDLEYFEGLGSDPVVPQYLQYNGKVRNLRLSRRELSVLINDVWTTKLNSDISISMQDFLAKYFTERYQQVSVRAEWAYNLCTGCEQMLDDPQIKLFWGTLNGTLSQDKYVALKVEWRKLKINLLKQARGSEYINVDELARVVKATFALKSEVDVRNIQEAIRRQLKLKLNSNIVPLDKLFMEPDEGFERTDLAKELYRQRQIAQDKYVYEIIQELGGKKNANKLISVDNLKRAFAIVDPHIDHIKMEYNIRWAFSDNKSDLKMIYPIALKTLASKLASGNMERVGPHLKGRSKINTVTDYTFI